MEGNENDVSKSADVNSCSNCRKNLDDVKQVIQCVICKNLFHGKCENVDMRGFHTRKLNWKCKVCSAKGGDRARKRSRVEENYIDQSTIDGINLTLELLMNNTAEMHKKIDFLIDENLQLKKEIADLKSLRIREDSTSTSNFIPKSYASTVMSTSKVLVVKQKGEENDIEKIKEDLRSKVNHGGWGVNGSCGKAWRSNNKLWK